MFDEGTGPPVIVIPGVQGRREWMPAHVTHRYRQLIPGSTFERFARSGHMGISTRPTRGAGIVMHAHGH